MKSSCVFCLDMGGTNLKACVVDNNHKIVEDKIFSVKALSKGTFEEIKTQFKTIFDMLNDLKNKYDLDCKGMSVSSPGPVDFKNGIPLMTHKYQAIYGLNLKSFFKELGIDGNIVFQSDVIAFFNAADRGNKENAVGITLGTGLGFCYKENGEIPLDKNGSCLAHLYNTEFEDGIYEDYFSARGLIKHYEIVANKTIDSASGIFLKAEENDEEAIKAFEFFGNHLGEALKPILEKYNSNILYIGGAVANGKKYFYKSLQDVLKDVKIIFSSEEKTLSDLSFELNY